MKRIFFHVEIEDCLWDEVDGVDDQMVAQLETQSVEHVSELFSRPIRTHDRRSSDGALVCSFTTDSLARVRETIRNNLITEGNDQIVSGAEYVIVRDFQLY